MKRIVKYHSKGDLHTYYWGEDKIHHTINEKSIDIVDPLEILKCLDTIDVRLDEIYGYTDYDRYDFLKNDIDYVRGNVNSIRREVKLKMLIWQ